MNDSEGTAGGKHLIAIIGAGAGGICMAIKLREAGFRDFVLLERESEVGGTWVRNRYPGLECDIVTSLYSFTFEQEFEWSRNFARQQEVKRYIQRCADKFGVLKHVRFNTEVTSARWDSDRSEWRLATSGGMVTAHILISALGQFNQINLPDIPGLDTFKGQAFHTAEWPDGVDLKSRHVAVVGSAATAVQVIPRVAEVARHLTVFQRTASWVLPKDIVEYSAEDWRRFKADPSLLTALKQESINSLENRNPAQSKLDALDNIAVVNDPAKRAMLTPPVPIFSQRPLFSNEYYPTFNLPHVDLVQDQIVKISSRDIHTKEAVVRDVDILIFATGFLASKFISAIDVVGRSGRHIKDVWKEGAEAYLGITVSGFPNLFMIYGPNTNKGSIMQMIEHQANYIAARVSDMHRASIDWIDVRPEVMDRYNVDLQRAIGEVEVWRTVGSKYYRAASGKIVTQYPYTMQRYGELTAADTLSSFEVHQKQDA